MVRKVIIIVQLKLLHDEVLKYRGDFDTFVLFVLLNDCKVLIINCVVNEYCISKFDE